MCVGGGGGGGRRRVMGEETRGGGGECVREGRGETQGERGRERVCVWGGGGIEVGERERGVCVRTGDIP